MPPLPIPNHEVHVSLCVWLLSTLAFFCLFFCLLSLSLLCFSQTYDDIDLENEPWYKFFSELEFGRPVSQGHSFSLNHNPTIGIHPLRPPHPWFIYFFYMSPSIDWVGLVVWACGTCWVLWLLPLPPPTPPLWQAVLCLLVWWLAGRHWKVLHTNLDIFIWVGLSLQRSNYQASRLRSSELQMLKWPDLRLVEPHWPTSRSVNIDKYESYYWLSIVLLFCWTI